MKQPLLMMAHMALACLAGVAAFAAASDPAVAVAERRESQPPRKILVGTLVGGRSASGLALEQRLDSMDAYIDAVVVEGAKRFPGRRLDLIVLPEYLIGDKGETPAEQAVPMARVRSRMVASARRAGSYVVIPMLLQEAGSSARSNAAVLLDRTGGIAGIYRKVHPVAAQNSDRLEGGLTPGNAFPVFQCDFGRVGIQICFDLVYSDGWQALADGGAELVACPSASPETAHPRMYALQHTYYVVTATPRDHAGVYNPLGMLEAEATHDGEVLVREIDLSYALVHWDAKLEEGAALRRRFGDRIGFSYDHAEDGGIFWSNDPALPIGEMLRRVGLHSAEFELARLRYLQASARGGPAATP